MSGGTRSKENANGGETTTTMPLLTPLSTSTSTSTPQHPHPFFFITGKLAGLDKKLSRSLDAEVATGCSPAELSKSPVGPLSDAGEILFSSRF